MTTYTNWMVGEKINICASIDEFCGTEFQVIFVNDINVTKLSDTCTVIYGTERGCGLHLNNVTLTFKLVKCSGSTEGHTCNPQIVYKTIGSATTNSNGVCGIVYDVTDQDRANYESQISEDSYKVMVCITNSDGQSTQSSAISETTSSITITPSHLECISNICTRVTDAGTNTCTIEGSVTECLYEPTHYLEFKMAFVPVELVDYIDTYIVDISNTLMTHLPILPPPWEYVKTTYNRNTNSFIMWLYTPNTLGLQEDIISIGQWAIAYVSMIVGVILIIIAGILAFLGFPWLALFTLLGAVGFIITGYVLKDVLTNTKKIEEKLNNANVSIQSTNKENVGRGNTEDEWNTSDKTKISCKTRLETHRDIHIAKIDGLKNDYLKYADLVTNLNTEKESFITQSNTIINEFDAQPYSEALCNSYYINIDNLINSSNITITSLIDSYVNPNETYEPTCTGWITKVDCETAKCYWYNNKCNSEPYCNVPLLNYCLDTPLTIGGLLLGGYVVYKIVSSKK